MNNRPLPPPLTRLIARVREKCRPELLHVHTGRLIADSTGLAPDPDITFASSHLAWLYQNWLRIDGMGLLGEVLQDDDMARHGEQVAAIWDRHIDFFSRQRAAGMNPPSPPGDERLQAVDYYFKLDALWATGLGTLAAREYERSKAPWCLDYMERYEAWFRGHLRDGDGMVYRPKKGIQSDDPYLVAAPLCEIARVRDKPDLLTAAAEMTLGYHRRLEEPGTGLYRHLYKIPSGELEGEFWARGNGWMTLAFITCLEALPESHPLWPKVLAVYQAHSKAILDLQGVEGMWHQVLDVPESWAETSATGMFLYGFLKGIRKGWLDPAKRPDLVKGFEALGLRVDGAGDMKDVCMSCDLGDRAYYMNRPHPTGNLHGYGPYLMAASEWVRVSG